MANFDELLGKLRDNAEETLKDEGFVSDLETAYIQSLETRDNKIESLEKQNTALDGKVKEYGVANFDLLRKGSTLNAPKEKKTDPMNGKETFESLAAKWDK